MKFNSGNTVKILFALIASAYIWHFALAPGQNVEHFPINIDGVNLLIHEAGHIFFIFFGTFLHIAGGTLFQVIIPALFIGYFYVRRDFYSASLLLLWLGENLTNISVYAGDAVTMQLQLLGGYSSGHDWHNMLDMLNTLPYTHTISTVIYAAGLIIIAAGTVLPIYFAISKVTLKAAPSLP